MDIHGWWDTAVPIITTVGIRIVGAGILYPCSRPSVSPLTLIAATFGTAGYPAPYVVQEHREGPIVK